MNRLAESEWFVFIAQPGVEKAKSSILSLAFSNVKFSQP